MNTGRPIFTSYPITAPTKPWSSTITLNVGSNQRQETLIDLSTASLRFVLQMQNTGNAPYYICKPGLAWFTNYTFTPTFKGDGGAIKSVRYNGTPGRGNAGVIYQLSDCSAANTLQTATPNKMFGPLLYSKDRWDITIPIRYLLDPAATKKFLPISFFTLTLSVDSFLNIFSPPSPLPVGGFDASLTSCYLDFTSYDVISIPRELMYPDPRVTITNMYAIKDNDTTITAAVAIPGKLLRIMYFFVEEHPSAIDGTNKNPFNMSPNVNTVVSTHQLITASGVYPMAPNYNSDMSTTSEIGLNRHYHEFLGIINKLQPSANTYITYDVWKDNFRIYGIEVNDPGMFQQSVLTFLARLTSAFGKEVMMYMICQYLPNISQLHETVDM